MADPAPSEALEALPDLTLGDCCQRWGVASRNAIKARAKALGVELRYLIFYLHPQSRFSLFFLIAADALRSMSAPAGPVIRAVPIVSPFGLNE
jgi:hypothetical protein